jgi:chemotaxis signal transduction protein
VWLSVSLRFSQSFTVQFTMLPDMEEMMQDEASATDSIHEGRRASERRKLCVMRSGARLFAVYADEVAATSENLRPTPLPFAPAPVRGVVSQRGQILTVIDPLLLPQPDATTPDATTRTQTSTHAPLIVALRGDEQLALSVERIEHDLELFDDEATAETTPDAAPNSHLFLRRIIRHHMHAIALLDPARIFEAAMQGVERRRRRQ